MPITVGTPVGRDPWEGTGEMKHPMRALIAGGLLAAAAAVVAPAVPVAAATIVVTTTADETIANGQTSLREAMNTASGNGVADTIVLTAGANYVIDFCAAGPLTHAEVAETTVQGGAGTSIQNTCIGMSTFEATDDGAALTLADLEMTGFDNGGSTVYGAAIAMYGGHLGLDGVNLHGFDAGDFGIVVMVADDTGPAGGTLSMVDSELWGSTGDGIVGARASLAITDSSVHDLTGVAVRGTGAHPTVTDSTVADNGRGGVNTTDGSPMIVTGSTVTGNGGPGLRTTGQGHSSMTVTGTVVSGNDGTGIACSACNDVAITATTVSGNGLAAGPGDGSGVRVTWDYDEPTDAPTLDIVDSDITGNRSRGHGGGVRIDHFGGDAGSQAVVTIDGTTISDNFTDGFFDIDGGGLWANSGAISITGGSVISGNLAGPFGGFTAATGGGVNLIDETDLIDPPSLFVDGSTIEDNAANSHGGGVYAVYDGEVTVEDSRVEGNTSGFGGGGIDVAGIDLDVTRTTVVDNQADVGGGIALREFSGYPEGSVTIDSSTLSGNESTFAASGGGGLFVNVGDAGADVVIDNSTISGNTSANFGGGVMVMQTSRLTMDRTTVVENEGSTGANVYVAAGTRTFGRSIIARPEGTGENCDTFSSATVTNGHSYSDDASCGLGASDVVDPGDPGLGSLADNGGPTLTHLPLDTSAVGGLVPAAECGSPAVDQRGVGRPQGTACEAGAVEIEEASAIMGTAGPDLLVGTPGDDVIVAGSGNDIVVGGGGNDVIDGGDGHDLLWGGAGDDELTGGPGSDWLIGDAGDDNLFGGAGIDVLLGGAGYDHLDGGPNLDLCLPAGGTTTNC